MRRSVERDSIEVSNMPNLVHPLRPGVLTGHDVAAQIDGNCILTVHAAFLAKSFDGTAALYGGIELVDALSEAKSVRILNQRLEDRPCKAVQSVDFMRSPGQCKLLQ
jgi:hypothetical protein